LWNRHISITSRYGAEQFWRERRGKFYESTGALRDMVPNHVFPVARDDSMEPPISFDANASGPRRRRLLSHTPFDRAVLKDVVRGQYGTGTVLADQCGISEEPNVAPDSNTETFFACKLQIDNWRWWRSVSTCAPANISNAGGQRSLSLPPGAVHTFSGTDVER